MGVDMTAGVKLLSTDITAADLAPVLVVGCGRWHRRDDQIGLQIAEALRSLQEAGVVVIASESPATDILTELDERPDTRLLVIIDAAIQNPDFTSGCLHRIVLGPQIGPSRTRILNRHFAKPPPSSHQLGVAEALRLGSAMELLPRETWIYALACKDFGYGESCSAAVSSRKDDAVHRIGLDIRNWLRDWRNCHA